MADRMRKVEMINAGTMQRFTVGEVPDYSPNDADREWIARELGDVEPRPTFEGIAIRFTEALLCPDYFGETVPVESLGRGS